MPTVVTYVAIFAATTGLIGYTTGLTGMGVVLGALLGGWYGYLRTTKAIGLGPLWLLFVMAVGGLVGPVVDADRHIGAIVCGIVYGWPGFLSDKITRALFAAASGFLIGGLVGGTAGGAAGAIAAVLLFQLLHSNVGRSTGRLNDDAKLSEPEQSDAPQPRTVL